MLEKGDLIGDGVFLIHGVLISKGCIVIVSHLKYCSLS